MFDVARREQGQRFDSGREKETQAQLYAENETGTGLKDFMQPARCRKIRGLELWGK